MSLPQKFLSVYYIQGIVLGAGHLGGPLAALWKLECKKESRLCGHSREGDGAVDCHAVVH